MQAANTSATGYGGASASGVRAPTRRQHGHGQVDVATGEMRVIYSRRNRQTGRRWRRRATSCSSAISTAACAPLERRQRQGPVGDGGCGMIINSTISYAVNGKHT